MLELLFDLLGIFQKTKTSVKLNLLVIRTSDMPRLVNFYKLLGFKFDYHKHEQGVYHYATKIGETVFEIYPLLKSQKEADISTRLGFKIDNFEEIIAILSEFIVSKPMETEFGACAILKDPDGRKIEVYKN
jgi:predicted enzyme related to lactoylglutathione lyase